MRVLVVNAGSSSVKLRLLDGADNVTGSADVHVDGAVDIDALAERVHRLGATDAVGHRVVHGGAEFPGAVLVDDGVLRRLDGLVELDPLHQPAALGLIRAVQRVLPGVPAVACFDTSFHATIPAAATTFAVPARWRRWGIRRFGFHGLSHSYASRRAAQMVGRDVTALTVVTCHLGSGASLAAVQGGVCVDTTMGFTPLDGLVMATRPGSLDPGIITWVARRRGLAPAEIERDLYDASGLRALAGTGDMAAVVRGAATGDADARLAFDVYIHRLRAAIGAMAATLGGLDVLVFTGGVGEQSPDVRAAAVATLGHLGVGIDAGRNADALGDADITRAGARAHTLVVTAREDLEIAALTRHLLSA